VKGEKEEKESKKDFGQRQVEWKAASKFAGQSFAGQGKREYFAPDPPEKRKEGTLNRLIINGQRRTKRKGGHWSLLGKRNGRKTEGRGKSTFQRTEVEDDGRGGGVAKTAKQNEYLGRRGASRGHLLEKSSSSRPRSIPG